MHLIRTECLIPAAPGAVWAVLADFDRYAEWNPLNIKAVGQARPGAKVPMTFSKAQIARDFVPAYEALNAALAARVAALAA